MDRTMDDQVIKVKIYGETFNIKGGSEASYTMDVASYVDKKMRKISESRSDLTAKELAVLASLNITDELFTLRDKTDEYSNEIRSKTTQILKRIEDGLTQSYSLVKSVE